MIGIIIGLVIMLADAFFIWCCCRVAGIVFTVLSVQPSAFTSICFGRTVDTFKMTNCLRIISQLSSRIGLFVNSSCSNLR